MKKINVADIITYGLLGAAIALCAVGAAYAYPGIAAMVVCILSGAGFLGILVALVVIRMRFWATYNYWTKNPVKMGFRGKPCWDKEKSELWIEAVIRFWTEGEMLRQSEDYDGMETRAAIEKALAGLTVAFQPEPWSYFGRLVVGLASSESISVKYEKEPEKSAFMHELGHVIIGNLTGDWDEVSSHEKMKKAGFTNASVKTIADKIARGPRSPGSL